MSGAVVTAPSEWKALLARLDRVGLDDIYFRPEYVNLYAKGGAAGELFVFESHENLFVMPWLVRPIASPALTRPAFDFETAYGYGGPVATSDAASFLAEAWAALADHCRARGIVCGFIRFHPLLANQRWVAPGAVDIVADRETVTLDLAQTGDAIWDGYSESTRGKVRKAKRAGVSVRPQTGPEALAVFAGLYHEHMEEIEAHEDYFFGDDYFHGLAALGEDAYRVYLAERDHTVLGGALVLLSRRWAHYHLSSAPRAYSAYAPNNLLRHAVIMDLAGGRRERIHFGGGRTARPDDSLLKFKSGYSPERAAFAFGRYIGDREAYAAVCDRWARAYPHLVERFGDRFLRYRYH